MKYFKLTYYLIFICIIAASCSADDIIAPDQASEEVRVQLTIQFPQTATRATSTDQGIESERNIDNLHLYVFEQDGASYILREEAIVNTIGNANAEGKRIVTGVLFEKYFKPIKLVALANLDTKGFNFGNLPGKRTNLTTFYQKLIYKRTTEASQWPTNGDNKLPMWGESKELNAPKPGFNSGSLSLTRAVARVDVLVNGGNGIDGKKFFKITQIEVSQFNDCGYCTPGSDASTPNVPTEAKKVTATYTGSIEYACANRIYIPEQKNTGNVTGDSKVFLNLTAVINETGKTKTFTIDFKKNGTGDDFDVLRNNVYVFNITSVKIEEEKPAEITLSYTVKPWDEIKIEVPEFGKK